MERIAATGEQPEIGLLEAVAKAMAFCHYRRGSRAPKYEYIETMANKHWRDFETDAHVVIEIINNLVQREAFDDAISALPQLPDFMKGAVN